MNVTFQFKFSFLPGSVTGAVLFHVVYPFVCFNSLFQIKRLF